MTDPRLLPKHLQHPFAAQPLRGLWNVWVRGFTPSEELQYIARLEAAVSATPDAAALRWWRDRAYDLAVGLNAPDYGDGPGGAVPIRARYTPVEAAASPDQRPVPYLHAQKVISQAHWEQMAGAAVQMWLGRHTAREYHARMVERVDVLRETCPGDPVASWMGVLSVKPLAVEDCDHSTIHEALAAVLSAYLLGGEAVPVDESAPPDLDAMGKHIAQAVTHRWEPAAGRWEPFRLSADMEQSPRPWTGSLGVLATVEAHNIAARDILSAGSFLRPWGSMGPAVHGMGQRPPFERDSPGFDAMRPSARMWARVGWSHMWAMEHAKRADGLLPGGGP